ncbi:MAG: hypothetical protein MAG431_00013 [Chloroflexi bacterium]|nr:hypothetical protein [Chloroflexota bacterium]
MIIECSYCVAKVDGRPIGEHVGYTEKGEYPYKVTLLECPVCHNAMLGGQIDYEDQYDKGWEFDRRLWPSPIERISYLIPRIVRNSLSEAKSCFKAKAYSACAVMCGRALEGVCRDHKTKSKNLFGGLKELLDRKIIDERLYQWGEALRKQRNLGAHATGKETSSEDVYNALDFVVAICEYVYVLSHKYEKYLERQAAK